MAPFFVKQENTRDPFNKSPTTAQKMGFELFILFLNLFTASLYFGSSSLRSV